MQVDPEQDPSLTSLVREGGSKSPSKLNWEKPDITILLTRPTKNSIRTDFELQWPDLNKLLAHAIIFLLKQTAKKATTAIKRIPFGKKSPITSPIIKKIGI
jgi:hypothetical protein